MSDVLKNLKEHRSEPTSPEQGEHYAQEESWARDFDAHLEAIDKMLQNSPCPIVFVMGACELGIMSEDLKPAIAMAVVMLKSVSTAMDAGVQPSDPLAAVLAQWPAGVDNPFLS